MTPETARTEYQTGTAEVIAPTLQRLHFLHHPQTETNGVEDATSHIRPAFGPSVRLGERDLLLLCDLMTYGSLLAEHIQDLYFGGRSRRRMNQRLRQLADAGLVVRRPLPLGLSTGLPASDAPAGIPLVYRLGGAAALLVATRLGWDVAEVRRLTRQGTPTGLAHTLEVVRLRLHTERAVRERNEWQTQAEQAEANQDEGDMMALQYFPERLLRHSYELRAPGGRWRDEVFKPDALIRLSLPGGTGRNGPWRQWFVEIDLGHTSSAEWGIKADIAVRYRRLGLFQKRYEADGFQTLVLTTGVQRRKRLLQLLVRRLSPEDAVRFGVATFTDLTTVGLLAPIWHVPSWEGPVSLEAWPEWDGRPNPDSTGERP